MWQLHKMQLSALHEKRKNKDKYMKHKIKKEAEKYKMRRKLKDTSSTAEELTKVVLRPCLKLSSDSVML